MIVFKVFVFWSMIMNLTLAQNECTDKTPWNCGGGINLTLNDELFSQLVDQKHEIAREFDYDDIENHLTVMKHGKQTIPEFFDSRLKWPMCSSLSLIRNQGKCGPCWAFASTMSTTDRLCIASKGKVQFNVSPQDIITCCKKCYANPSTPRCKTPASLVAPMMHMIKHGVVSEECKPYDIKKLDDGCKKTCIKNTISNKKRKFDMTVIAFALVKIKEPTSTLEDIQIEMMKYGPISARLDRVTNDFLLNYTNKVYIETKSKLRNLAHAVKIIGWGTENGVPYWLCANSWGPKWGKLGGFFKIRRGSNELGMEKLFIAIDTNPENRPSMENDDPSINNVSGAMSFTKTLQLYTFTIIVIIVLSF